MIKKITHFIVYLLILFAGFFIFKELYSQRHIFFWSLSVFTNNPSQKIKYLNKAIELKPAFNYLYIDRAWAYIKAKKFNEALSDFHFYRSIYPNSIESWYGEGVLKELLQENDQALNLYSTAIALEMNSISAFPWVYKKRGNILKKLGHQKEATIDFIEYFRKTENYEAAIDLLDKWIAKEDNAHAREMRGKIYQQLKEYDKAYADFTKVIELAPEYGWGFIFRSRLNFKLGKKIEAINDLNAVIKLNSEFADAYMQRAEYFEVLNEKLHALCDYQKAAEIFQKYNLTLEYSNSLQKINRLMH